MTTARASSEPITLPLKKLYEWHIFIFFFSDEASGNSKDWGFKGLGAKYSYVVELRDDGKYGFLLPEDQIIPCAEENYAAVLAMANKIHEMDP